MSSLTGVPVRDLFDLTGKTAIVTGGTGGIGISTSTALAGAGADIVSIQLPNDPQGGTLKSAMEKPGRKLWVFECNLKNHESIRRTFQQIWASGITPDILVNGAGITHHSKIVDTTVETIDNILDINIKAAYTLLQEFGKKLLELQRPGKIIHIASMASYIAQEDISVYASSKSFVRNMTRALSNEWASRGIQCNCISPGFIQTAMSKHLHNDPEFNKYVVERTSSRRWGYPDDMRGLIVFLASRASDFITGESIVIDGGVLGR
ncbi:uncharacterized protein Z518_03411 [Rhinocladiella mackenziei CBS 650.93]|uniref:2-deoxy-D-gluconate 3-dehydrogenase n=1 Tax=Rhinocladiella mackenziei CBS 650.93 TaxID=1442369 RepID=A0A0D2IRY2_9EURO|nr:uncharacterized protein Z518_03411 [Rhinocladiella mackenziei CBS 650.93]KIX08754.1 hypothetical protein Z518_03411 [Rhinocladiella mackenziei CBS 650.93]